MKIVLLLGFIAPFKQNAFIIYLGLLNLTVRAYLDDAELILDKLIDIRVTLLLSYVMHAS